MTFLIGISGKIGSGKDYLATHLVRELTKRGAGEASSASFAWPLKNELTQIMGEIVSEHDVETLAARYDIPLDQMRVIHDYLRAELVESPELNAWDRTPGIRSALQYLGTNVRRAVDTDYWVRLFHEAVNEGPDFTFATDVRFPNEADSILAAGGYMIRLEVPAEIILNRALNRDGLVYTQEQLNHPSETGLDDYTRFDLIVGHEFDAEQIVDRLLVAKAERNH